MTMLIRRAVKKDISSILTLYKQLMDQHRRYHPMYVIHKRALSDYKKFVVRCMREKDSLVLVADVNNHIAGFVTARIENRVPIFKIKRAVFIYDIVIDRKCRGKGAGAALVKGLKKWTAEKKIAYIKLEVSPKNKSGFAFWQRCGFHVFQHKMACRTNKKRST